MEVKIFINQKAKNQIKQLIRNKSGSEEFNDFINIWLDHQTHVKCYILYEKSNITNICLLHKCDSDPLKQHSNPHVLDYLHTFAEYRRNNFAYNMLSYVKSRDHITAFVNNDNYESERLFKKAGYISIDNEVIINTIGNEVAVNTFRFP